MLGAQNTSYIVWQELFDNGAKLLPDTVIDGESLATDAFARDEMQLGHPHRSCSTVPTAPCLRSVERRKLAR